MSDRNYLSWRSKKPQTAVSDTATQRWELMLNESKNALDDMAKMIHQAGYHLETGEKLVGLLEHHEERVANQAAELGSMEERIFSRLDAMECRIKSVEKTIHAVETEIDGYQENLDMTVVGQPEVMMNPVASFDRMVADAGRGAENDIEEMIEIEGDNEVGEVDVDSYVENFVADENMMDDSIELGHEIEIMDEQILTPPTPTTPTTPTLESATVPIPSSIPLQDSQPSSFDESNLPAMGAEDVEEEPMISFQKLLNEHRDHAA